MERPAEGNSNSINIIHLKYARVFLVFFFPAFVFSTFVGARGGKGGGGAKYRPFNFGQSKDGSADVFSADRHVALYVSNILGERGSGGRLFPGCLWAVCDVVYLPRTSSCMGVLSADRHVTRYVSDVLVE